KSAVAIGKFDGIHLGHRKLIDNMLEQKKNGCLAVVFTFEPSPEKFFRGKEAKELMTIEEKRTAFERLGIDVLIEFPLNKETAAIAPERFITEYLIGKLKATVVVAGTDISFGNKGAGNAGLLREMAQEEGFFAQIIDKVTWNGEEISSTLIREAVRNGDMEKASALLGAPYRICGEVVNGRRFGRKLGMPTVNQQPSADKLLPPNGVYYSYVWLDNVCYRSVSNVGCKPTVSEERLMGVETYIYDFDSDIYGRKIEVELLRFKRAEIEFASTEALKEQMRKDIDEGMAFHHTFNQGTKEG
ncbi:MAG: bifunctional riboflavin kinase/FAD synthetase, partial [Butyrivibrio sp.]|nr:bifunctional riboflavin kinase/FAD synthetase [Butyrivibrio sp.]